MHLNQSICTTSCTVDQYDFFAEFAWKDDPSLKAVNLSHPKNQISAGSSLTLPIKGRSVSESAYEAGATLGCQFWGVLDQV